MRERPIIFSAPMVLALLEGLKTQTRRIVKRQPLPFVGPMPVTLGSAFCPYGQPGDRLWVRETCRAHELSDAEAEQDMYGVMERRGLELPPYGLDGVIYAADGSFREIENTQQASNSWTELFHYRGKRGATVPPIHMPRWASRITLEITNVQAQPLQQISERDCCAEGCGSPITRDCKKPKFIALWESIHGEGSWNFNPWVWAIEFRVLQ